MFLNKYEEKIKVWFSRCAEGSCGTRWLAIISFSESSFFPIPPDPFLMAILLVQRHRWFFFSMIVIVFSVLGGIFGYFIGLVFYETVGRALVDFYHLEEEVQTISQLFADHAFWTMFTAAFTPIPYKVFTISAGLFNVNFFIFVLASVIGRGLRYLIVGLIMKFFGERLGQVVFKYFNTSLLLVVLCVIAYTLIKVF